MKRKGARNKSREELVITVVTQEGDEKGLGYGVVNIILLVHGPTLGKHCSSGNPNI